MAPLLLHDEHCCRFRKVLSVYLALLFFTCVLLNSYTEALQVVAASPKDEDFAGRKLLELEDEDKPIIKMKTSNAAAATLASKNQTKLLKLTNTSSKNQTKLIKSSSINGASKNQTKLIKTITTTSESTKNNKTKLTKPTSDSTQKSSLSSLKSRQFKKLNSTSKASNSTKASSSDHTKKSSDLAKTTSAKNNKTTTPSTTKETKTQLENNQSSKQDKTKSTEQKPNSQKTLKKPQPSWIDDDDEEDLVAEFRDLPSKFQETILPDLDRISRTSQVYLTRYNKEITKGVKPLVGNKYANTIASIVSFAFIIIPLILVSLIFNRITAYFSLQKLLIFIQVYLSIYFSILCLSSLFTGLEPLKFFYATSRSTYVCLQVLQTLAYVLYLLLLLMYLILVFSTETGLVTKLLGLGQTFVGFAVGLHYYMKVFHRAVLRQPPKTSWKVHALYATCFLVICLLTRADRRKKAYLEEGGEEGKKS